MSKIKILVAEFCLSSCSSLTPPVTANTVKSISKMSNNNKNYHM